MINAPTNAGSGVNRRVLFIGDSTMAAGLTVGELKNLFAKDAVMAFTPVGTRAAPNNNEGVAGASFYSMATNWDSPFVFSGEFSFQKYCWANSIVLNTNDWVIFHLGQNYIWNAKDGNDATNRANTEWYYASNICANIRSTHPFLRIAFVTTPPMAPSQDAWAFNINGILNREASRAGRDVWIQKVLARHALDVPGSEVIPLGSAVDPVHAYPMALYVSASKRVTNTVWKYNNALHYTLLGDQQCADIYYHFLKAHE